MTDDLHNIDNIFYNVLEPYEELPSHGVWEDLNAGLDKMDAPIYKSRFTGLRRFVAVLIFMLAFLIIQDADFIKNGYYTADEQTQLNTIIEQKIKVPDSSLEKTLDIETENTVSHSLSSKIKEFKNNELTQKDLMENIIATINKTENSLADKNKIAGSESNNPIHLKTSNNTLDTALVTGILNDKINIDEEKLTNTDSDITSRQIKLIIPKNNTLLEKDISLLQLAKKFLKDDHKLFIPYWTATGFANREWSQYNLENDVLENSQNPDNRAAIAKRENHEPSYMFGALATYWFKKHLSFQTGLEYSNTAITIEPQKVYAVKDNNGGISYKYNTSSGYAFLKSTSGLTPVLGDSIYTTAAQHTLEYISLPVLIRYNITVKKFSLSAGAGLAVNLLTSAKIQTEIKNATGAETVSAKRLQGIKSFYTDVLFNAGIQYKIKGQWSLNLLPSYRYALSPINKNNVVKTFPYSFGLGIGCTYKF